MTQWYWDSLLYLRKHNDSKFWKELDFVVIMTQGRP